jgi:predicted negative regulator of RcsB-dependent stress response
MKRKERAHLKEDPFQIFIQKVLDILTKFKREIFIGVGAVAAIVVVLVLVLVIRSGSVARENSIYSEALSIKNDTQLDIDQKIEKLNKIDTGTGISASVKLFLAALHFEKGDVKKAGEVLDTFQNSSSRLINDKKKLLDAEILNASGEQKEALEKLNSILADPKSEVPKDYVLLRMAKIQVKTGQTDPAITNLNKLIDEYAQSFYSYEARTLLQKLEKK